MNIKKYFKISLGVAMMLATQISCVHDDNWDAPEIVCNNKFDAPTITMAAFAAKAPTNGSTITIPNGKDDAPVIFDAYVVSSDASGNFYKTISFQDDPVNPTVGLQVGINKSMNYADFPVGAHIRIKANGLVLGRSTGVVQIGSVDPNYTIGRIPQSIIGRYLSGVCNGNGLEIVDIVPRELTMDQLKTNTNQYVNTLVKLKDVQFIDSQVGMKLMDKDASGTYIDTNRTIENLAGKTISLRTDGFFKGTAYDIPNKSGDITFVVSKYCSSNNCNDTQFDNYQYVIRGISDINFTKDRLPKPVALFEETFASSNFTANNWTIVNVAGPKTWEITTQYGNPRPSALMNGFQENSEDWLISKEISLEGYSSGFFTFDTWRNFTGDAIKVYVTDNYSGTPGTTQWTAFNPILATSGNFVNSGEQSLNAFVGKKIRIAFKYTSTSTSAASWELDNVKVVANK